MCIVCFQITIQERWPSFVFLGSTIFSRLYSRNQFFFSFLHKLSSYLFSMVWIKAVFSFNRSHFNLQNWTFPPPSLYYSPLPEMELLEVGLSKLWENSSERNWGCLSPSSWEPDLDFQSSISHHCHRKIFKYISSWPHLISPELKKGMWMCFSMPTSIHRWMWGGELATFILFIKLDF